jgi:hypothetical protein
MEVRELQESGPARIGNGRGTGRYEARGAGTYAKSMSPGASLTIVVRITATFNTNIGAVKRERLQATPTHRPISDTVLGIAIATR